MLLFALTLASTDKDPCHGHKSDDDNDPDHGYDQDDYFVQVQHDHNITITTTMTDHDLVRDHDDHDDHDDNDDLDQVLHALLRALHQEGERKAEEEIPKHARGGLECQQLWQWWWRW